MQCGIMSATLSEELSEGCRQLHFSTTWEFLQFGRRAFSVCGPCSWNKTPSHIINLYSPLAFGLEDLFVIAAVNIAMHYQSHCCR